jgi:hypothetical protein
MNAGIVAIRKLTAMGYRPQLEGESIRLRYEGPDDPDPAQVRPLLALVKEHKPEVLAFLSPAPPERVLTCYECSHFRPAVSPNPSQAWGHCEKRNRGRFGAAMACEAILTSPGGAGVATNLQLMEQAGE